VHILESAMSTGELYGTLGGGPLRVSDNVSKNSSDAMALASYPYSPPRALGSSGWLGRLQKGFA
jgi:hypothetical protein